MTAALYVVRLERISSRLYSSKMPTFFHLIFSVGLFASLTQPSAWMALEFDGVPPNQFSYGTGELTIDVVCSGSPLVSVFPEEREIRKITVTGKIVGELNLEAGELWSKNHDDALLRFGLVEPGNTRLSPLQRIAAPAWIKALEKMFSEKMDGLGKIRCFHLMPDASLIGRSRTNPNAEIFMEQIQAAPEADGSFVLKVDFADAPMKAAGLWMLADGDDTDSSFSVTITDIKIAD